MESTLFWTHSNAFAEEPVENLISVEEVVGKQGCGRKLRINLLLCKMHLTGIVVLRVNHSYEEIK